MARIVQDSDEESDGDLEGDLPPPKQASDASGQSPSNDTHGTGSTGRADYHKASLLTRADIQSRVVEKSYRKGA
jgi:hypothetical protein